LDIQTQPVRPWQEESHAFAWQPVCKTGDQKRSILVFLILFIVLLVIWLLGFVAFHVAGGLIHLLLIIAVISLIVHLFQGRRAA
jgi:Family of unknown function (DUF5670)